MKLVPLFKRFNKTFIYNEYYNVTDDYADYDKITREKMLNRIIEFYKNNPNKIIDYCNEQELRLLEKLSNNKLKKYEYDDLYKSLHSKLFLAPEKDGFSIIEEFQDIIKMELMNVDYKKVRKKDDINKKIIGLMKLYGVIMVDMLADMYMHYYSDFSSLDDCKNYILNSFYLRHYIFITEETCYYNDYYGYLDYVLDNIDPNVNYKYFNKDEVDSISRSKYNIDEKYIKKVHKVFKDNNMSIDYADVLMRYAKEVLDKGDSIELIDKRIEFYLRIFSPNSDFDEVKKDIISILLEIPCVIYKGNSLKEMTNMVLESELVRKTKEHSEEISKKSKIKKYKELRKESIEALKLCEQELNENILRSYGNLFNINKIEFDMESLVCQIVSFIPIDDEEALFYRFFRKNISINNKYYEVLNSIKNSIYNSLFLVKNVDPKEGTLLLYDTKNKDEIEIIDISLSTTRDIENKYIYTSIFKIEDIHFTSGYIIPLIYDSYEELIKSLKIQEKRIRGCKNKEMIELLAAYKLYSKNKNISFSSINIV